MELIQPLEGASIHRDWLAERGEGLHHIGVVVPSVAQASEPWRRWATRSIQSGRGFGVGGDGDGAFAYIDATPRSA